MRRFDPGSRGSRNARAAWGIVLLVAAASAAHARVHLTVDQALRVAFGEGAKVEREVFFLTGSQLARARELAGPRLELPSSLVTRHRGSRDGAPAGWAYFDTHRVRTLQETVMVVVAPDGKVAKLEILSFLEPEEYLPRKGWLGQVLGRGLDGELAVNRGIHGITGATLSAHAVTDAVRRVLAIHQVLAAEPSAPRAARGEP